MARRKPAPLPDPIRVGAETLLGRLASEYRLGQLAAWTGTGPAPAGRPELRSLDEIQAKVAEIAAAAGQQSAGRISQSYICAFYDKTTGARLFKLRTEVEADAGTSRSTMFSRARRLLMRAAGRYLRQLGYSERYVPEVHCQTIAGSRVALI